MLLKESENHRHRIDRERRVQNKEKIEANYRKRGVLKVAISKTENIREKQKNVEIKVA
jgi:HSP20 family molecular chaperone IbpA